MSDYTTTAKVELEVNGKQAEETLSKLKQRASDYRDAIAKAAKEGNSTELKQLRKELKSTEREIKSIQSASMNVADVMRRLDNATPKELKSTLKQLTNELNNIERGSNAWHEQVHKIQAVKKELESVNSTLATQRTTWQKISDWVNKWQTMAVAAFAVVMKVVSSAKQAVNAYASIDQEMANTQKFTGMTREAVELLNEEFKNMDTRSSREGLNKLAQSAGRLGKDSVEDVLGFVRAGDKISVAMDELGEDAPEIISKLSGIFNLEADMGTEKAMLSTGSAVNTLSQVCAASAPKLVDFSSRFGAIASSSNMAMSEMLAFGAVLDSNGVTMEKGATAMQGVVTRMYAEPSKFAKIANLDAKEFTETLKRSSTEGLMMFIDRLSQMDQMQMSATLKELGTAGAGVTQTFQTLANKSEELKLRMQQSNKAFIEATSVDEEFAIQNNTVQAGLDKAKKKFNELAVSLGKELLPIMKHVKSSTSATMQVFLTIISFVKNYTDVIVAVTASLLAYNIAVHASAIKTTALAVAQGIAKAATMAWAVATQAAAVVTAVFTGHLHKAKIEFMILSGLLKASPIGLLAAGITAVVGGLAIWISRGKQLTNAQKAINDVSSKVNSTIADEKAKIQALIVVAENEQISMNKRLETVSKLNAIIPGYNAMIDKTTGKYKSSKTALDAYLISLEKKIRYEANMNKLTELISSHEQAVNNRDDLEIELEEERKNIATDIPSHFSGHAATGASQLELFNLSADARRRAADKAVTDALNDVEAFKQLLNARLKKGEIDPGTDITSTDDDGKCPKCHQNPCVCYNGDTDEGNTDKKNEDRFKAEKEWKEREEALNAIAYATGEHDYEQYMIKKASIQSEYYEKLLDRDDLMAAERLTIESELYSSLLEERQAYSNFCIAEEEQRYKDALTLENQRYINGQTSYEAYTNALELLELDHLRRMVNATEEGSKERAEAEKKYQDKLLQDKLKKRKETEAAQEKIKNDFFGPNAMDNKSAYDASVSALDTVYNQELVLAGNNAEEKLRIEEAYQQAKLALQKKYGILAVEDNRNALEVANAELLEWLESDAGKAVMQSFDTVMSGMGAIFSQVSSIVQSELEIQTAAIEKRYDKEISLAEGNSYKVAKLEKQKEKEIAKAKNEANKKMFAMQVIQAIAQTATNAINAYGSAAAIPVVGFVMAPIAAAMAVAAGALQIAAIKKQQQASEAQGYSKGGFTPKGAVDEEVGVVHAGEWVASQKLLANPVARPLINALDYAQRTNTIGSLRSVDVSRAVAPQLVAQSAPTIVVEQNSEYTYIMKRLAERLDEPFVTVNTITGDNGIKKAQDEYDKLIRNKSPKSKRK